MAKVIAVANMKGGVGKTTTSIILSDALSAIGGKRVVALDLDSQANLSWALLSPDGLESQAYASTMTRWLEDIIAGEDTKISDFLEDVSLKEERNWLPSWWRETVSPCLHLAVSNTDLRFAELEFEGPIENDVEKGLEPRLRTQIELLSSSYDYIVMDCSPALAALTRAGLRVADAIIVPTPLNQLCLTSALNFKTIALEKHLGITKTPLYMLATRVGAASGQSEASRVRASLQDGHRRKKWAFLQPEFPERVEYTRALDPPTSGPHQNLRSRYKSRVGDLKKFLESLEQQGVIQNDG